MERRERRNAVTVLAPAKLNLALDVVGLLPNGYHALDMTMQTITLYERVVLRRSAGLSLQLPGSPVQPNDKNTAIKAALAFFHYTGLLAGVDIMPDYGVSTPEAFAAYDTVGSSTHPDCEAQEAAIRAGDLDAVCAAAGNALEECSGAKDNEAIKALLRAHGAVTALMTGSGAAVFGVFRDEAAARAAAAAAKRQWPQVYVAQPDRGGARVIR